MHSRTRWFVAAMVAALMTIPLLAGAQTVAVTARASKGKITLTLVIPAGYHIYGSTDKTGVPTSIQVKAPAGATITPAWPKTTAFKALEGTAQVYMGKVVIPVSIKGAAGKQTVKLAVRTQMCNDRTCLPPAEADITMGVNL